MTEQLSKTLLAIEAVLLVPVTLLLPIALFLVPLSISRSVPEGLLAFIVFLLAAAGLLGIWGLMLKFWDGGRKRLAQAPAFLWGCGAAGVGALGLAVLCAWIPTLDSAGWSAASSLVR